VCCADISSSTHEPEVYVFPAKVVADGLHYYFSSKFPNSDSYHLSLNFRPQGKTKTSAQTVGEFINAESYRERFDILGLVPIAA
jgi:hypothetical protein